LQNAPHFFQYRPKHPAVVKIDLEAVPAVISGSDPCLAFFNQMATWLDRAGPFKAVTQPRICRR
jgi:hypothetical protein